MECIINNITDEDKENYSLIDKITNKNLEEFREKVNKEKEGLNKLQFVTATEQIFDLNAQESIDVFNKIHKTESNCVTWNNFLNYLSDVLTNPPVKKLEFGKVEYVKPPHVKALKLFFLKRESITKIVLIESENYFCYAIISKYGRVGLYDGNFDFLTSYSSIMTREDAFANDQESRKRNRWITDALFMQDIFMFAIVNSSRSMVIYDVANLKHVPIWLILGFHDAIQSLAYMPPKLDSKRKLIAGTDRGEILLLIFHKSKDDLLKRKHSDKLTIYFQREFSEQKDYISFRSLGMIHRESVRSIEYFRNSNYIISSSKDNRKAIVIIGIENGKVLHAFQMKRGANCFAISSKFKLLITGSDNGAIRIWNFLVPAKPLQILNINGAGVTDIKIFENLNMFATCFRDAILKLWDMKEYKCIQTISLKFPFLEMVGTIIEWAVQVIHPGPKRKIGGELEFRNEDKWERPCILVTCCNYYAKVDLIYLDDIERNFEAAVLPPPPLQNSFLIPKDWKICENEDKNLEPVCETISKEKNSIESIKYILEKDFLEHVGGKSNINYKIAMVESKKLQMQWNVEHCAPYLALDLYEINEIALSPDLPVPNSKRIRNLVEKTQKMLADASARSIIFSETSSSSKSSRSSKSIKSPGSSRSSIVEFNF